MIPAAGHPEPSLRYFTCLLASPTWASNSVRKARSLWAASSSAWAGASSGWIGLFARSVTETTALPSTSVMVPLSKSMTVYVSMPLRMFPMWKTGLPGVSLAGSSALQACSVTTNGASQGRRVGTG